MKQRSNMATALLFASIINIEEYQAIKLHKFGTMNEEFINHDN